jgi:hypothetical protein
VRRLVRSAVECPACGDVLESTDLLPRATCGCGRTRLDGGLHHQKIGWTLGSKYRDLSEWETI